MPHTTTILTIFAGRRVYMQILMKYVRHLLAAKILDECHVWDYSRNFQDHKYLLSECSAHPERPGVCLMGVQHKGSWREYYDYYATRYGHRDDMVLLKCDDDIVYLDVGSLPAFIEFTVAHPEHLFTFPAIINNGVIAHMQQRQGFSNPRLRIGQPSDASPSSCPHEFELRTTGFESLIKDGKKAAWMHNWFLGVLEASQGAGSDEGEEDSGNPVSDAHVLLALKQRISINFFAVRSQDLKLFAPEGGISDDENYLTQILPSLVQRHNSVFPGMTVSHFGFGPQRDTGLCGSVETSLLQRYDNLAQNVGERGRRMLSVGAPTTPGE